MDPELDNDSDLGGAEDYGEGYEAKIGHLIVAVLHDDSLDLKAKRKKILKALQLMDEPEEQSDEDEDEDEPVDLEDADDAGDSSDERENEADDSPAMQGESAEWVRVFRAHSDPAVRRLAERFDRLRSRQRVRLRRAKARQLCRRANLPPAVVSRLFIEQLLHAPDERAMLALIEDRRRLAGVRVPRSAGPGSGAPMDLKEFAKQLRRGA
jgi:hypothetical protein